MLNASIISCLWQFGREQTHQLGKEKNYQWFNNMGFSYPVTVATSEKDLIESCTVGRGWGWEGAFITETLTRIRIWFFHVFTFKTLGGS